MRTLIRTIALAALYVALTVGVTSAASPAVSGINGKVGLTLGSIDGDNLFLADGGIAFPLGNAAGLQFDAGFGEWDATGPGEVDITRLGLHLFVREPGLGMAGIYAGFSRLEVGGVDIDIDQYGIEGEFYNGPLTVAAVVGQNDGDIDDELLGVIDLRWYPLDDLMLEIGTAVVDSDPKVHLGTEYQLLSGLAAVSRFALSAYVDLAVGDDGYDHALLGLRGYFGSSKSLVKRHREDVVGNSVDRLNPPLIQ